jgi:hypothetical protein
MQQSIAVYENGANLRLQVRTDGDTVWLTQEQMSLLFGRDQSVIARHISNIFREGELEKEVVYAKFAYTTQHGAMAGKTQVKEVGLYNLDVIISVGYRVKSIQGTRFRQWATRMLRELLLRRYEDARRIDRLETRVDGMEQEIKQIKGGMNYLVKQLSAPPKSPKRRKIGFDA